MQQYTPMIQQYLKIKAEYQDAFLFFRLGDFYEMFFEDAELASKVLEITLTGRDGGTGQKIPMCGVPYHSAESYVTKLIENGYKVAICEQVEDPKSAKGVVKREVVKVITPGTVMEGRIIDNKANNFLVSVFMKDTNLFGLAAADLSTGEFYATEIGEDISLVISELNQYNPSELLLNQELYDIYHESLKTANAVITIVDNSNLSDCQQKFTDQFSSQKTGSISNVVIISSGQLLSYLNKTQQKKLLHFNEINLYDFKQFMVIDQFSKRNLELIHTSREQTKKGSLLWLLDQTETAMGSRLLRRWLEKPLLSQNLIAERLNSVEEFKNDPILTDDLNKQLKNIYDIERMVSKVAYGNATPRDLYNLRNSIERVPDIYQLIEASNREELRNLINDIDICQDVASLIKESIQDDPPLSPKVGGLIKQGFNKLLDQYYLANTEGKQWLQNLEKREREATGIKSLKVGFNKVFGYYIEVTRSNLSQVPTERYIRKQTLANAERYITEELKEKEELILEAEEKMQDLEYQIFVDIREQVAKQNHRLQHLAQQIAKIDVLLAFATISSRYKFVKPKLNQEGKIIIQQGRHPVIEAIYQEKPFIPNDVYLDQKENQILMITGPNMAGKSTYMRQAALTAILAQIGCFIPAKSANLAIIDRIFTRIGAGDDLTGGQSTFMVEMMETKNAITQATENSLILLDEIGRGTSTYDGMALAQAIIQYIHEHVQAKTLFSTHYHELTTLADNFIRIQNIHVNVIERDGKVIFLHKIEKGKADKSYGIHVAELAGMPKEVIDNAKEILKDLEAKNDYSEEKQVQLNLFKFNETPEIKEKKEYNKKDKLSGQIAKEIESLDLLNLTPMEGFQILFEYQKRLRK